MLKIFKSGHDTLTSDIETWVVRWNKRYSEYSGGYKEVAQFFTSEKEARDFKDSLDRAIKLLGHTAWDITWTKIEKINNSGCE
jgi:hypothetical protein